MVWTSYGLRVFASGLFRIEGDLGAVPAHHRPDAAARHLHRDPPRRRRDHEAQAGGAAQHRHRPRWAGSGEVRLRLPRATHSRLRAPVSGRVRLSGLGAGLQRPALPDAHPHLGPSLSLRLRGGRPRRAAGTAQDPALPGHAVRLSLGAVRRVARRLAQAGGAGHEPGRGAHREAVVQLRPGPGALGQPRGPQLPPTARPSSARRRVGAGATRRCRGRSASRCWRR